MYVKLSEMQDSIDRAFQRISMNPRDLSILGKLEFYDSDRTID